MRELSMIIKHIQLAWSCPISMGANSPGYQKHNSMSSSDALQVAEEQLDTDNTRIGSCQPSSLIKSRQLI